MSHRIRVRIARFGIAIFSVAALPWEFAWCEAPAHEASPSGDLQISVASAVAPKPVTGAITYQRYRASFRDMCELINRDGRREYYVSRLSTGLERDEACRACRPLLRALVDGCKEFQPKEQRSPKRTGRAHSPEEDGESVDTAAEVVPSPTPTRIARQREPAPALIQVTGEVFSAMADDEKTIGESYRAVQKLSALLVPPGVPLQTDTSASSAYTPGARDYFAILLAYIQQPFANYADELARSAAGATREEKSHAPKENVDDMFDF